MKIPANTPTREITIQGVVLSAPVPYAEGHPLTANEAASLNQTFLENLRNNFAAQIKKKAEDEKTSPEKLDKSKLQAEFNEYIAEYEFGVHRAGVRIVDPIVREATAIAEEVIKASIRAKGYKLTGEGGIGKDKFNELVAQYAQREDIRKEAARRVKVASSIQLDLA